MLKRFLRTIRRQSVDTRNNVAFGIAAVITAVIGAGWWQFESAVNESRLSSPGVVDAPSAFSQLFDGVSDGFSDAGEVFKELQAEVDTEESGQLASAVAATATSSVSSPVKFSTSTQSIEDKARIAYGDLVSFPDTATTTDADVMTTSTTSTTSASGQSPKATSGAIRLVPAKVADNASTTGQ